MKGQDQDSCRIVCVQPGTLTLTRPEGEEVLEYFLVGDDPADDSHQHQHGGNANNPSCQHARQAVELKMKAIKKAATTGFAHGDGLAARRIQG